MMGMSSKREILHEDMSMCSSLHMMDQDLGAILKIYKPGNSAGDLFGMVK